MEVKVEMAGMEPALRSPWAVVINRHMRELNEAPVRHKMLDGRSQYWVSIGGRIVAGEKLRDLAASLGLDGKGTMQDQVTDWITVHKAARITGYSKTALLRACRDGELQSRPGQRGSYGRSVSRMAADEWAAARRKMGGAHLPRKRRKGVVPRVVQTEKPEALFIPGSQSNVGKRLARYLSKFAGTPLEVDPSTFVERVVIQALDKLEA